MKAAVFSDTHGSTALMVQAIRRFCPDVVIHLGDYDRDTEIIRREFPDTALYAVAGNCDMFPSFPYTDTVPLGPVKAFITHGHIYNVEYDHVDSLVYAAQEEGAKLAMFGHTHRPYYETVGGVTVINPGTAGRGSSLTWAKVEVFDNGGISCQILPL